MPLPLPSPVVQRPPAGRLGRRLGAALLVVVTALSGCTAENAAPRDDKVELSVFWWGGDRRAELTKQALAVYTERYPDVTFKFTYQGNAGYFDRLSTEAAAGNAPDIFQIDDNYLTEYAQREILLDLTDYVRADVLDLRKLPAGLAQSSQVTGRTVAAAAAENTPGLIYNKSLLDRYDLPEPQIGMSYQDYLEWAERITERTDGEVYGTMDPSADYKALWVWLRSQDKELYRGRQVGFTESDLARWFELWADARKRGAAPPAQVIQPANSGDVTKQLVASGQAATSFVWSNQLPELQKLTRDRLKVVSYPGKPAAQWARASLYWAAFRGTRHPETVVHVIDFLVNDAVAGEILGTERGLSANLDVRRTVEASLTDESMKQSVAFETTMTEKFGPAPVPPPKGHATVKQLLIQAAENVQFGRASPRTAAASFVSQANAALTS
ncbi:ABC transporter substrate-binding protein [Plantactinospora sp. KLBMP9567]|uniref:ABC transporter substrate-binding protein n=1 Tax=Plantactinospora sp. KLBMP9567 TaxID=3085900 RepID=UPI0029827CD5|nr:ABC transporter substrate-binding protein [Plantactinospora sp. KLBMP9567]MDW5330380.1 ABC transporter substrate-binding protein [Plantactinospora sp. KLBMP9567]